MGFEDQEDHYRFQENSISNIDKIMVILDAINVEIEAYKNNLNVDPEVAKQRKLKMEQEMAKKNKIIDHLKKEIENDRAEKEQDLKDRPIQSSKGKQLKFGATIKKCSDILPPPSQSR